MKHKTKGGNKRSKISNQTIRRFVNQGGSRKVKLPAIVALSHPCNMLPIVAAMATSTAPLIFSDSAKQILQLLID